MIQRFQILLMCIGLITPFRVTADGVRETPEEVVKDVQNPVTDRASIPITDNTAFQAGPLIAR